MQRVRQLVYDHVYSDEKFKGKRMANGITILARDWPGLYGRYPWLKPGATLAGKVDAAGKMGTTLWFDQDVRFEPLVEVGEASVCFVLLKHIIEDYPDFDVPGRPVNDLFQRLQAEWSTLNRA
jgi:hypothetical protein